MHILPVSPLTLSILEVMRLSSLNSANAGPAKLTHMAMILEYQRFVWLTASYTPNTKVQSLSIIIYNEFK